MKHHPRCGARTRSGRRCRRYVAVDRWTKKLRKRCRNHGGLSTGPKFPDGKERSLAAANAGLERWRERMRAAKAAGLIAKFPCGRKSGPTRRQRELEAHEREEALAHRRVEIMDARAPPRWPARRGGSRLVIGLERLERHFIERLSDRVPPSRELIEGIYDRILLTEERFGRPDGKMERLICVRWAIDTCRERQALNGLLAELAQQRAASTRASNDSALPVALPRPPPTDGTAQVAAADAEAAALARLAAEAAELITSIKIRLTHAGWPVFDAELDRARHLAKIKAAAEGVEVTERALRTAEIDVCRHTLAMIRASQATNEAIKARYRAEHLRQAEAERERELDRGVPMTLPGNGVSPRYRLP